MLVCCTTVQQCCPRRHVPLLLGLLNYVTVSCLNGKLMDFYPDDPGSISTELLCCRHHSGGIERSWCPSVRLCVCHMPIAQKWCILELWLLWNTNRKPRAGNWIHQLSWPHGHQKWPKRPRDWKICVINMLKPSEIESWLLLNMNRKS